MNRSNRKAQLRWLKFLQGFLITLKEEDRLTMDLKTVLPKEDLSELLATHVLTKTSEEHQSSQQTPEENAPSILRTSTSLGSSLSYPDLSSVSDANCLKHLDSKKASSVECVFKSYWWNTERTNKKRTASLTIVRSSFPDKAAICHRFWTDSIPHLSILETPVLTASAAAQCSETSSATLMCSVAASLETDNENVFNQTTEKAPDLFDSRKYASEEQVKYNPRRSQSEPSISTRGNQYAPASGFATTVDSSWCSLFEENGDDSSPEALWAEAYDNDGAARSQHPQASPITQDLLHQPTSTDSGFTTARETPHPQPEVSPSPAVAIESEPATPTLRTMLRHLLEHEGDDENRGDFADEVEEEETTALVGEARLKWETEGEDEHASSFLVAERMRLALERLVDLDTLIKCYNVAQELQESEDDELSKGREVIASIVGQARASEIFDKVLQLVLVDGAYVDGDSSYPL